MISKPGTVIGLILSLFMIAVLLKALYPMIDTSFSDLKTTFLCSTNTYVKSYLPDLADYTPFLFIFAILIGLIFGASKLLDIG